MFAKSWQVAKVSAVCCAQCWITKGCGSFGRKSSLLQRKLSSVHAIFAESCTMAEICRRGVLNSYANIAKSWSTSICWQFVAHLCNLGSAAVVQSLTGVQTPIRQTRVGTIGIAMINGITTWQATRTLPLNIFSLRNFASWILITTRSVYTFLECLCSAMHCLTLSDSLCSGSSKKITKFSWWKRTAQLFISSGRRDWAVAGTAPARRERESGIACSLQSQKRKAKKKVEMRNWKNLYAVIKKVWD